MTIDKNIPRFMITDHLSDLKSCLNKVERLSNCIKIANLINSELSIEKLLSNVMKTTKKAFLADAVSMRYESGSALEDVSFELTPGERIAIVGPNGAGKSTLIKVIAGVQEPTAGKIEIFGHDPDGHICITSRNVSIYVSDRNSNRVGSNS